MDDESERMKRLLSACNIQRYNANRVTIDISPGINQELVIDLNLLNLVNANGHDINGKSFDEFMGEIL